MTFEDQLFNLFTTEYHKEHAGERLYFSQRLRVVQAMIRAAGLEIAAIRNDQAILQEDGAALMKVGTEDPKDR